MDNPTLVKLLSEVPETRLRLLELTDDVITRDGELDLDAAVSLGDELEHAVAEARTHAGATKRLVREMTWMLKPHRS